MRNSGGAVAACRRAGRRFPRYHRPRDGVRPALRARRVVPASRDPRDPDARRVVGDLRRRTVLRYVRPVPARRSAGVGVVSTPVDSPVPQAIDVGPGGAGSTDLGRRRSLRYLLPRAPDRASEAGQLGAAARVDRPDRDPTLGSISAAVGAVVRGGPRSRTRCTGAENSSRPRRRRVGGGCRNGAPRFRLGANGAGHRPRGLPSPRRRAHGFSPTR